MQQCELYQEPIAMLSGLTAPSQFNREVLLQVIGNSTQALPPRFTFVGRA